MPGIPVFRRAALAAALALTAAFPAAAQAPNPAPSAGAAWPTHPVRVIIPQPPGGVLDILIRALAGPLSQQLSQPIVVDNRPGGNNVVGLEACATAAPDGYTICAVSAEVLSTYPLVEPALYARYSSLVPVTLIARNPGVVLANPGVPAKDLREFATWARTQNGLNYGSSGQGSTPHLLWEYIKGHDNLRIEHVPYRGIVDAFNEMAAGRTQVSYIALGFALEPIATGRVKPLAVLGRTRSPRLPEVPSLGELGYDFPYDGPWWGFAAPARTPDAIQQRIAAATKAAMADPGLRQRLLDPQAYEAVGNTPAEFAAIIKNERERGVAIVRAAGIEVR
ncbi:tripartite tricarboxylate transporter substrate binding protein [Roseomonas pecuniae]|uniref:Tripartite tricarboxylate transporter substrate binding protein n=2 Tax=Roseomonas populi TaxID=3121582 RepID=A0ABT1X5F0_9PROT|nr:tripartite tricarboxylate transporter substrate binding protein [Roseomonas pecuniae]